jgi:TatD DNase family protein
MFDSHAHLPLFPSQDREPVLQRACAAGVRAIMNISLDAPSLSDSLKLQAQGVQLFHAAATPPHGAPEKDTFFDVVKEHAGRLSAIGEVGLDYFHKNVPKERQIRVLSAYLDVARECNLPVIFHCREAFDDLFEILQKNPVRGIIHCFTGSIFDAQRALDLGLYISISGIVTFKNSQKLRDCVASLPLERLCVETDAPYLAPQAYRGQTNEPAYIAETIRTISELKNISYQDVVTTTTQNAYTLFQKNYTAS